MSVVAQPVGSAAEAAKAGNPKGSGALSWPLRAPAHTRFTYRQAGMHTYSKLKFIRFFLVFKFYFIHMDVLPACLSVYHLCAWCPQRPEEDIGSLGFEVVSCRVRSEPRFSERAVSALNC